MGAGAGDSNRGWIRERRAAFAALVLTTVGVISWRTFLMLEVNGWNTTKAAAFGLFVLLLTPIALSFWTATLGFLVKMRGDDMLDLTQRLQKVPPAQAELPRTAVVVPVYNEDPGRVFAGVKATYRSLERTGLLRPFDIFILSDSTDPDVWVREEMAFADLRQQTADPERLFYRNRRLNVDRKTGNLADFCARWGDRYTYMIVFDADSIMSGESLLRLVRLMEMHPSVGLIQAPPLPVNRRTLFGRLFQFASHAYSVIFITGLNFWQGGAGNYWGHNAIIRIRPFVEHCRLPTLPGKPPLGGSILSHDFIEAAFLRRAGWKVYLASEIRGSYEEVPSSLIGFAARDRRWCQGNLQHSRLLFSRGLHLVNRVHLCMGIMGYVASPLWLLLMALTTAGVLRERLLPHDYFKGRSPFPNWQISVNHQAILLFVTVMMLLLLPKILSVAFYVRDRSRAARFGGRFRLALSVLGEVFLSTLLAPNLALLQARFVVGILMGRNVKWDAQDRGDTDTSFREALRRHWQATLLGVAWAALLAFTVPTLLAWFSPVIAGLVLAIPLSAWTSKTRAGQFARRHGLFLIPEEVIPSDVLRFFEEEMRQVSERAWSAERDGLAWVLEDPTVRAAHLSLVSPPPGPKDELFEHYLRGLMIRFRRGGSPALSPAERRELLLDPESVRHLRGPDSTP